MTVSELRELIASVIDEKLAALIDEGTLEIEDSLRERLLVQKDRVDLGDRGLPADDVVSALGLS